MYNITENTLNSILSKKFGTLVGTLCERIEEFENAIDKKDVLVHLIKKSLKKDAYNTMREIKEQIKRFSDGTKIEITLLKSDSDNKSE